MKTLPSLSVLLAVATLAGCGGHTSGSLELPVVTGDQDFGFAAFVDSDRFVDIAALENFTRIAGRVHLFALDACEDAGVHRSCEYDFQVMSDDEHEHAQIDLASEGAARIHLTTGMMSQMANDDEIAFVLLHEVSHHLGRHAERMVARRAALAEEGIVGSAAEAELTLLRAALEREADQYATIYSYAMGYDPVRGVRIVRRLGSLFHGSSAENYRQRAELVASIDVRPDAIWDAFSHGDIFEQ